MTGRSVHVVAQTNASEAACTGCGVMSRRVHRYPRQLADTASGGLEVLIKTAGPLVLLRQSRVR